MEDEEEHVDPRKLTSLADIKKAYDKLCEEEVREQCGGRNTCSGSFRGALPRS